MPSSVPSPTLGTNGFTAPEESAILTAVLNDFNSAFGGGLNMSLSTPQGQLSQTLAAIIADKNSTFLYYTSQVDPQFAQGRMQDAIGRIYFLTRFAAAPTLVSCLCTGLAGTVIPAGAQAKDTSGNIYSAVTGGTIGAGGTVTLDFQNTATGPISCPAGTLTRIYVAIPGWDTITNPADGVLGRDVENAQAFEQRRKNSVAINAKGTPPSIFAAVFASGADLTPPQVPTDVLVIENPSGSPLTIGSYTLLPHSVYVAVVGGDDASIAAAIWSKKDAGCDYNGSTSVVVEDTSYTPPRLYTVKFQRPTATPIYFDVKVASNPNLPADLTTKVQAAIVAAALGQDGGPPLKIGSTIYASRFYAPVAAIDPSIQILSIAVGTAPSPTAASVSVGIDAYGTASSSNVTVEII